MRTRTSAALTLFAAAGLALAAPLSALADDPVDLQGAYVVDTAGVLTGSEPDEIGAALDQLYERAGIQLFVVYVPSFTGATDAVDWADTTAIDNGLGANDVLLAVAVDDRQYALSIDSNFTLSDAQVSDAENAIEAELRDNNWAQAAIAGAQSLEASATGVVGPGPDPTSEPAPQPASGGGIPILPIVGGVAVVGVGVYVVSRIRRRGKNAPTDPTRMSQKDLDTRAGSLLVQLDDSLKTSEQELGFAQAQFGEKATADFTAVLASAKSKVAEAFAIKQKLDDAHPEPAEEKRTLTARIIELCEAADAELDSQADAFDALRELEKNAPKALDEVTAALSTASARAASATRALDTLRSTYAASAVAPVADNPAQAAKLLEFATAATERARTAIAAGTTSEAALAVREAQAAVGQADQLFTAVDALAADLGRASTALDTLIGEVTSDLAAARALPQDATAAELGSAIESATGALSAAEAARTDPVAAVARLTEANTTLDTVAARVRDAQAQAARARSQLDATIAAAQAQIQSAAEFIATRRGGVGEPARTRVAEADRALQQAIALGPSDPVKALAEAQRAAELGSSAFQLARNDVDRYASAVDYGGPSWSRGTDGADLGGLLGGIIGGMIGSSGGSRGGWSGSSRSGGSSGWSSSRSTRSGGFGGSSRSSARSSSSGRGRSRGGRF